MCITYVLVLVSSFFSPAKTNCLKHAPHVSLPASTRSPGTWFCRKNHTTRHPSVSPILISITKNPNVLTDPNSPTRTGLINAFVFFFDIFNTQRDPIYMIGDGSVASYWLLLVGETVFRISSFDPNETEEWNQSWQELWSILSNTGSNLSPETSSSCRVTPFNYLI